MKTAQFRSGLLLLLLTLITGMQYHCSSSSATAGSAPLSDTDIPYTSMLDRLRKVPNLSITGPEDNPIIRIRGNRSLQGENEPLFEVDGTIVGNGYQSVISVDVNQVESIRVVPPAQAAIYGARGGNGVIKITTRD